MVSGKPQLNKITNYIILSDQTTEGGHMTGESIYEGSF